MVQLAYPLCKLAGVGDGGRQEHIINLVWEEDDGLFPDHTALYTKQDRGRRNQNTQNQGLTTRTDHSWHDGTGVTGTVTPALQQSVRLTSVSHVVDLVKD